MALSSFIKILVIIIIASVITIVVMFRYFDMVAPQLASAGEKGITSIVPGLALSGPLKRRKKGMEMAVNLTTAIIFILIVIVALVAVLATFAAVAPSSASSLGFNLWDSVQSWFA